MWSNMSDDDGSEAPSKPASGGWADPQFPDSSDNESVPPIHSRTSLGSEDSTDEDHEADDGDPEEEVLAAVVVDDDNDDNEAVAVLAAPVEEADVTPKRQKPSKKSRSYANSDSSHKSNKRRRNDETRSDRLKAATDARSMLIETVQRLPLAMSESHVVRSFGRINLNSPNFATPNNLFPVGFSCDRYEFSPVHGRILKLRCTILDGDKLRSKQLEMGMAPTAAEGPLFRIMWGEGIDDQADCTDYPYDLHAASTPITASNGGEPPGSTPHDLYPDEGMRVRVRYEDDKIYVGTIVNVTERSPEKKSDKKNTKKCTEIRIQYDDGSTEDALYPDPDITLYLPGSEDTAMDDGIIDLNEINGKPVTSVIGVSPLDAWGKALVELGIIDLITLEDALEAVHANRNGLVETKGKVDSLKSRTQSQAKQSSEKVATASVVPSASVPDEDPLEAVIDNDTAAEDVVVKVEVKAEIAEAEAEDVSGERELATKEEKDLRAQVRALEEKVATAQQEDRMAAAELANAKLGCIGPFLCNPFEYTDSAPSQIMSWLSTVVRKEKAKMGSTGNKKKVVTATDLLERNDTFFSPDIEALVEGLPGTERTNTYIFQVFRSSGPSAVNQAWIHANQMRQEREREKVIQLKQEADEAAALELKVAAQKDRELKRQRRDDMRDARKRQKQEEMDLKKKARAEERLARLSIQVHDRLFKEACFQREKVILSMAKSLSKEYSRRRKAAELVAGQFVLDEVFRVDNPSADLVDVNLPPLGKTYNEEVVRVWDFISSYGESFLKWGYMTTIPTLDSLQSAINFLRDDDSKGSVTEISMERTKSIQLLVDLCVALCKPLAVSLTRLLFASLIALNPALQKDFGAAFFAEVRTNADSKDEVDGPSSADLLPVNERTWKEIARLAFLADTLGELNYSKQEIAHLLRGYRSMGHPNSKEAKRLRRTEDFPVAVFRQRVSQASKNGSITHPFILRLPAPTRPVTSFPTLQFYFHNIKGLSIERRKEIIWNLKKAQELVMSPDNKAVTVPKQMAGVINGALAVFEQAAKNNNSVDDGSCKKARTQLLRLLDQGTGNMYSRSMVPNDVHRDFPFEKKSNPHGGDLWRTRMGLFKQLMISRQHYKDLAYERRHYMRDALILKEEMMKEKDDDDDEDEDDDEMAKSNHGAPKSVSEPDPPKRETSENAEAETASQEDSQLVEKARIVDSQETADSVTATVVENGADTTKVEVSTEPTKIGKVTPYDDFCGDICHAPEPIRRCLAVLRSVAQTNAAEHFLYPVDPQTNPGYYETVLRPMCLREVGRKLQAASKKHANMATNSPEIEHVVTEFARQIRLIAKNCSCYPNAGPTVIAAGDEMLRIFERLLFDWVLVPGELLPALQTLDDDRCVDYHESDDESLILVCDGCEGNYNMGRLNPPLKEVPKGDWFCPRCLSGRCWATVDPRIGKTIPRDVERWAVLGTIKRCFFFFPESDPNIPETTPEKPELVYEINHDDGIVEYMKLEEVDRVLHDIGQPVMPVKCIVALSESPGYGRGTDRGLFENMVPVPSNPNVSDAAAHAYSSSSVYRDTIASSSSLLLLDPEQMKATEWLRLLILLLMKCSSSEMMQSLASRMEADAAEKMGKNRNECGKRLDITDIIPTVTDNENSSGADDKAELGSKKPDFEDTGAVAIDANAVEVVGNVSVAPAENVGSSGGNGAIRVASEFDTSESRRSSALEEKEKRQKIREEGVVGFAIKSQLRPTVASFEEDNISQVVDNLLGSKERGLNFASCRCRMTVCAFCGLTDSALGSPLVRVPSKEEWDGLIPHMSRLRRVFLVADLEPWVGEEENSNTTKSSKRKDIVSVSIRVDGDIFSYKDPDFFEGVADGGMMEFLPRSAEGFQSELKFRGETHLPFVTGSLSAHDCCAVAAHNSRKEKVVHDFKENRAILHEKDAGITCGRTLPLGKCAKGRSYWKLSADPSLFVCDKVTNDRGRGSRLWRRYEDPEVIANVIHFLHRDPVVAELSRVYPEPAQLCRSRRWRDLILKNAKSLVARAKINNPWPKPDHEEEDDEPYEVGEEVLVESKSGTLLWHGKVISTSRVNGKINGYRIHYEGWSSRFDEWVEPIRVVEPTENNLHVQDERCEEFSSVQLDGVPTNLEYMVAKKWLHSRDRARGRAPLPDLHKIASVTPGKLFSEKSMALVKAALLLIEISLPIGAVNTSPSGIWAPSKAAEWRKLVKTSTGAYSLMALSYLLEEAINSEWMDPHGVHILSCLPQRWKAIREASLPALWLRVSLIDQAVNYSLVDKQKYSGSNRRR